MQKKNEASKLDQLCDLGHRLSRMSPVQKRIADFLLADPEALASSSITRLAQKIRVDPASITRFCQSLGFTGFADFKFSIERNILSPLPPDNVLFEAKSSAAERIRSTGAMLQQALGDTLLLLDRQAAGRAAKRLAEAGTVHIYAHGGASASALYAHTLFMQIGVPCYPFSDSSLSAAAAALLGAGDVAIGISSSGASKVSLDAMNAAKTRGATIIAITGFSSSPMAQLADCNINYNSRLKDDIRHMHMARMCELSILGILQMLVLDVLSQKVDDRLETIQWAMQKGRYASRKKPLPQREGKPC